MSYIKPSDVHAPKRYWSLIHVIFDGGPGPEGSSLAIGRWENKPVLAMRWNGTEENPLGNPQSRGLPTWFVVPDQHWKQILQTEQYKTINEDTLSLARNFLELERVYFVSRCPNPECRDYQKLVLHEWRTNQLGAVLKRLEQDEEKLYHIICNWSWKPSPQEKEDIGSILKPAWEKHRLRSEVKMSAR